MKHIRMFENAQQAADILPTLEYNTLSAIRGESGISLKPGVPPTPSTSTPFYVENITQQDETLTITGYDFSGSEPASYLEFPVEYSTDGTNWSLLGTTGATPLTRTLHPGDKVYLRTTTNSWTQFDMETGEPLKVNTINGVSKVGGNIMSLLYGGNFTGNETTFPSGSEGNFSILFNDINDEDGYNRTLVSASELILPATTLAQSCYANMFFGCTALTTAPALPATTLAEYCYQAMFDSCAALTTAPALPATALVRNCYDGMFSGCTSLTTAPALPAETLAERCYSGMFGGCTSLTTAPSILPATTLAEYCYGGMFEGCTSLTTAPELPATTLAMSCYSSMFQDCTSLTTAPELPATTLAQNCYWWMFNGCTALTSAPTLPATTLVQSCYANMFFGCTSLNYIKCLATDISATNCTAGWVSNVASTGTFVKNPSMSGWPTGTSGIPEGWTAQDAA